MEGVVVPTAEERGAVAQCEMGQLQGMKRVSLGMGMGQYGDVAGGVALPRHRGTRSGNLETRIHGR